MKLFIIFILLNILNVIFGTLKTIFTVKGNKVSASIWNALSYGFNTVVIIYMTCELSTVTKALVVATCNLIGVFVVKSIEEKAEKEKLWKIDFSLNHSINEVTEILQKLTIPFSTFKTTNDEYTMFSVYCKSKADSKMIREVISKYKAVYFVTESKGGI